MRTSENQTTDNQELATLNKWIVGSIIFIAIWMLASTYYLVQKVDVISKKPIPVLVVDGSNGTFIDMEHSNVFTKVIPKTNAIALSEKSSPMFEQKSSYEINDLVIINYFFIEGIVVDKNSDDYTIMYKDHNRRLDKITVSKSLLFIPNSKTWINHASLLAE